MPASPGCRPTHSLCASCSVRLPPRRIRTTVFLEAESTRETNTTGSDRAQLAQFPGPFGAVSGIREADRSGAGNSDHQWPGLIACKLFTCMNIYEYAPHCR